jgi:hypothetical protein
MGTWYWISVVVLTALLLVPASRLVWVLSVRRLERRTGRALDAAERDGQLNRARFLALILCFVFSALFNYHVLGAGHG